MPRTLNPKTIAAPKRRARKGTARSHGGSQTAHRTEIPDDDSSSVGSRMSTRNQTAAARMYAAIHKDDNPGEVDVDNPGEVDQSRKDDNPREVDVDIPEEVDPSHHIASESLIGDLWNPIDDPQNVNVEELLYCTVLLAMIHHWKILIKI